MRGCVVWTFVSGDEAVYGVVSLILVVKVGPDSHHSCDNLAHILFGGFVVDFMYGVCK